MGLQLIICVETTSDNKSDYIYIKNTIEYFYMLDTSIKLTPVFMGGKYRYNSSTVSNKINSCQKQFAASSKNNQSHVIICVDCDNYKTNPKDAEFLKEIESYCNKKASQLVWFCKDIEEVYLGEQIPNTQKKKKAERFQSRKTIQRIDLKSLYATDYREGTSNVCSILDQSMNDK